MRYCSKCGHLNCEQDDALLAHGCEAAVSRPHKSFIIQKPHPHLKGCAYSDSNRVCICDGIMKRQVAQPDETVLLIMQAERQFAINELLSKVRNRHSLCSGSWIYELSVKTAQGELLIEALEKLLD